MSIEAYLEAFLSLVQQSDYYPVVAIAIFSTMVLMALFGTSFVNLHRLKKSMRTSYEAVWLELDEAKIHERFKSHITEQSQPLLALGYASTGIYLASEDSVTRTEAACYLHPKGHEIIEILHIDGTLTFEILSYLDDGSVISSNIIEDAATTVERARGVSRERAEEYLASHPELDNDKRHAEMAPHGFLVCRYPDSTIQELIGKHRSAVQAVLADPNVGLRKLTSENWREYAFYQQRHFNQVMFDIGRKDNAPQPFVFPAGELVGDQVGETASCVAGLRV